MVASTIRVLVGVFGFVGLLGCASAPPVAPAAPAIVAVTPCESVMRAFCARADSCGAVQHAACFSAMAPACAEIVGITPSEAGTCVEALLAASCDAASLPPECLNIGTVYVPPPAGLSL